MTREEAKRLVEESNQRVLEKEESLKKELGKDRFTFGDWVWFNQQFMPVINEASDLVSKLHAEGITEYRVNMQSGIIS